MIIIDCTGTCLSGSLYSMAERQGQEKLHHFRLKKNNFKTKYIHNSNDNYHYFHFYTTFLSFNFCQSNDTNNAGYQRVRAVLIDENPSQSGADFEVCILVKNDSKFRFLSFLQCHTVKWGWGSACPQPTRQRVTY